MTLESELKLVRVHWRDTSSHEGWYDRDELERIASEDCMVMQSVGCLMKDGRDHVVLARSVSKTMTGGVLKIPKLCVIGIYWLKEDADAVAKENPYWAMRNKGQGEITVEASDDMPDYFMRREDD